MKQRECYSSGIGRGAFGWLRGGRRKVALSQLRCSRSHRRWAVRRRGCSVGFVKRLPYGQVMELDVLHRDH